MSTKLEDLKGFFENQPLYVPIELFKFQDSGTLFKLQEIQFFCEHCNESKPLHNQHHLGTAFSISEHEETKFTEVNFTCVTCRIFKKQFHLTIAVKDPETLVVHKYGEYPQQKLAREKELAKFFKNDKENYNKAVICLAHGYGIGAFAYMRRIVEGNISVLLDLIAADDSTDVCIKEALESLRKESPMSDKIKIANNALPLYLKPDGLNPLGTIYKELSEGVHSLPDSVCLEKAKLMQNCILFLISELASHKRNRENFKKNIGALTGI